MSNNNDTTYYKSELLKLVPGFFQGITRVTISYPFDVIKVNLQKLLFKNTYETISYLVKNDIFRFYRGSSLSYVSVGIERSIQFYLMERMNNLNNTNPYINSLFLSVFSSIYSIPVQYMTTNIAINQKVSIKDFIKNEIKNPKNLYKGYAVEFVRNSMGSTIFMGTYYWLRNKFGEKTKFSYIYGGLSGISVWLITFPLDTIRTDYQTTKSNNILNLIINRVNNNGIHSFYRGIFPVLLKTIPSASIGMYVYEYTREKLLK
jgi:solute carrier family 25 carnitine/acylcarnitine transporter 20/29